MNMNISRADSSAKVGAVLILHTYIYFDEWIFIPYSFLYIYIFTNQEEFSRIVKSVSINIII